MGYYNLKRSDFPDKDKYSYEFFKDIVINDKQDDIQTAIDMFYDALRDHRTDIIAQLKSVDFHKSEFALPIHDKDLPYKERDLQTDTINNFKRQIAVGDKEMLMYAVMRFGKTYTACRCVQEMENNRFTVIVSAKADVKYEWVDQVNPYKEFENYDMYFVKGDVEGLRANLGKEYKNLNEYLDANPQKHIMLFLTLQDLDGYTKGNKKDEYAENFNFFQKTHIDLLIIDEAHYGAQGKSYGLGIQEGDAYDEEDLSTETKQDSRVVMHLHPALAPFKAAILPLSKKLSDKALEVYGELAKKFNVEYDEAGSIGKRYRRQDEIGTPFCITIDFDTLEDESVTVRDRDSMEQERVKIADLEAYIAKSLEF